MYPKITWLLAVKNGMPYLTEMLASIEAQTYKNWEILVWDNGSTDGTIEELQKWIPSRLPGRAIVNEPLTLGKSLARLVEMCETELCARIDADDVNLANRLEQQVAYLSEHPEIAILGSWLYFIDELGNIEKLHTVPLEHDDIVHQTLTENALIQPSAIFRRSAILAVGNYRDLTIVEDLDLWLRIIQRYRLGNVALPLVKYRVHSNSTSQLAMKENSLDQSTIDCLAEHAKLTYGCSSTDMRQLQQRNHVVAMLPLLQIVRHLQKNHGGRFLSRLRSPSLIKSAKSLLSPKDAISRLAISSFDRELR
jgi:glycosyltransferase involved in cell wall biosynthesis